MNKLLAFTLFTSFLLLNACSPFSKVYSEEEPGVNMYKYHTFNWQNNENTTDGNKGPEWLTRSTQTLIRNTVEQHMERQGFAKCTDQPDLILHYHVVVKNEVLYVPEWPCDRPGEGQNGGRYDRCNRIRPVQYHEGTLIIDLIDTKDGAQVWRGAAVSILNNMMPNEVDDRIKSAIKAIFKKFPAKPKTLA